VVPKVGHPRKRMIFLPQSGGIHYKSAQSGRIHYESAQSERLAWSPHPNTLRSPHLNTLRVRTVREACLESASQYIAKSASQYITSPHSPDEYIRSPQSPKGLFGVRIPIHCEVRIPIHCEVRIPMHYESEPNEPLGSSGYCVKVRSFIPYYYSAPPSTYEVIASNLLF
jgi:hypothetical protein